MRKPIPVTICTTIPVTILLLLVSNALVAQERSQSMPREDVVEIAAMGDGLVVSNLFQSNMVLQRDKPIHVWGWARPGEEVTVEFAGNRQTVQAAEDRSWKVTLPPLPADRDGRELIVQGTEDTLTLDNILVGDVWVLGGQSNMEFPLSRIENGELEIASANFPLIRILTVPAADGPDEKRDFPRLHEWSSWFGRHYRKGDWDPCTPEIARELSAIGFVFARRLHMATQVPIGVIDASRGGTTVETWTPNSILRSVESQPLQALLVDWDERVASYDPQEDLSQRVERFRQRVARFEKEGRTLPKNETEPTDLRPGPAMDQNRPGNCYASMIAPLAGLSIKGAIFHQGYNNCFNGTEGARMYRDVFPHMIVAWRQAFEDDQLPFGILSLCTEGTAQTLDNYSEMMANPGPYIREAQYQTFLDLYQPENANVGFVSTYDLRRRWYHPQLKIPAGERIARWALASQYGFGKTLRWKPPMLQSMEVDEGQIVLKFDEPVDAVDDGGPMLGFAVAGADRKFHPAEANHLVTGKDNRGQPKKDNTSVVLTSSMVEKPIHYRYAWGRSPLGNMQAARHSDVPLATQRSDDWPLEAVPLGVIENVDGKLSRAQNSELKQALQQLDIDRRLEQANQLQEATQAN